MACLGLSFNQSSKNWGCVLAVKNFEADSEIK